MIQSLTLTTRRSGYSCDARGNRRRSPKTRICCATYGVLLDCGLRPEECHRLRGNIARGDTIYVPYGKTINARREIPVSELPGWLLASRTVPRLRGVVRAAEMQ